MSDQFWNDSACWTPMLDMVVNQHASCMHQPRCIVFRAGRRLSLPTRLYTTSAQVPFCCWGSSNTGTICLCLTRLNMPGLQDTLYYLPAEAHALGWQQQGSADRLYSSAACSNRACRDSLNATVHSRPASTSQPQPSHTVAQPDPCSSGDVSDQPSASPDAPDAQPRFTNSQAASQQPASSSEQSTVPVTGLLNVKPYLLPEPFRQRPRLGSRLFVQSHFPGMAAALAAEMCSWQTDLRIK